MTIKIDDELAAQLTSILKDLESEQKSLREAQVRFWKGLELYWKHIQDIFWDASVKDYRHINDQGDEETIDTYYVDKIVNIYRAHGESIIAAASQDVPQCVFSPEDADNEDDVSTAKNWTLASELINKHNHADILTIRALYLFYNSGIVAAYVYPKPHERNGFYEVPEYGRGILYTDHNSCAVCGADLGSETRRTEVPLNSSMPVHCEYCDSVSPPITDTSEESVPVIKRYVQKPKPRPCIELYSGLNVMLPQHVRTQEECGFLVLYTEADEDFSKEIAGEDFEDKVTGLSKISGTSDNGEYDRWARTEIGWNNEDESKLVTWRRVWFRPWMYNRLTDKKWRNYLRKNAPRGLYFLVMNDVFIEAEAESMDDCWVIAESPISSHIATEPIGAALKPIQDIYSEIVTFQLQSLEYSIPDTFADPAVMDFQSYEESRAAHGSVYPIKSMPANRALADAFTTLKTSNYARESEEFKRSMSQDGQFVIGSFPSIYGGPAQGGSKTYAEYAASRSQALQRLSIVWKLYSYFWSRTMEVSVKILIENMKEDEKFTKKSGDRFINIWIRKAEMAGSVGRVEPETANTFPMSWAQKHDALIKLLEFQNPNIEAVLTHPENTSTVAKYLGFSELYIPGEDDRNKQLEEIDQMLQGIPVAVDPELDNHAIEFETIQAWCKSEHGRDTRIRMPEEYMIIRQHGSEHKLIMDQQAMQQALMQNAPQGNDK